MRRTRNNNKTNKEVNNAILEARDARLSKDICEQRYNSAVKRAKAAEQALEVALGRVSQAEEKLFTLVEEAIS